MNRNKTILDVLVLNGMSLIMVYSFIHLLCIPAALGQTGRSPDADILYIKFNKLYKLDQNLVNGVRYYKTIESVSGNEFFMDEKSFPGKITVNNVRYENVFLKYDLLNQHVILDYDYPQGGKIQIIIDNDKISEFEILDKKFVKYDFPLTGRRFFQTIQAGQITCLIYYKKEIYPSESSLQYVYRYSDEKRKFYLLREGNLYQFNGQSSFLKLFPENRDEIKKFIRRYNLQLRVISEGDLIRLLDLCNDLLQNNSEGLH